MTTWVKVNLGLRLFNATAWTLLSLDGPLGLLGLRVHANGYAPIIALFFWLAFILGVQSALDDDDRRQLS